MKNKKAIAKSFGKAVKELRLMQGLTQSELARACGLSSGYISDVERGRVGDPKIVTVLNLYTELGGSRKSFYLWFAKIFE